MVLKETFVRIWLLKVKIYQNLDVLTSKFRLSGKNVSTLFYLGQKFGLKGKHCQNLVVKSHDLSKFGCFNVKI